MGWIGNQALKSYPFLKVIWNLPNISLFPGERVIVGSSTENFFANLQFCWAKMKDFNFLTTFRIKFTMRVFLNRFHIYPSLFVLCLHEFYLLDISSNDRIIASPWLRVRQVIPLDCYLSQLLLSSDPDKVKVYYKQVRMEGSIGYPLTCQLFAIFPWWLLSTLGG